MPLGVEPELFRERLPLDPVIRTALRLPRRYFFSVASDYPHKNLTSLLDAYGQLRSRWEGDEPPPSLVLAGHSSGTRTGLYPRLESEARAQGLVFLGPVSQQAPGSCTSTPWPWFSARFTKGLDCPRWKRWPRGRL